MTGFPVEALRFSPEGRDDAVSAVGILPESARALLVLAHGAGAGMDHPFLSALADRLANRRIATLRFQFPYAEQGRRRPDAPARLTATVRGAVGAAAALAPGVPLYAGGKSMGGRMTSLAAAERPLPRVHGLVFVGFPLHPAGRPGTGRAEHLARVDRPMLFLQGTRDRLADLDLLRPVLAPLDRVTLHVIEDADHGFHMPRRAGRNDEDVLDELADVAACWMARLAG